MADVAHQFGIVTPNTPLDQPTFVKSSPDHRPDTDTSSAQGWETLGTEERRNEVIAQQATWLPEQRNG